MKKAWMCVQCGSECVGLDGDKFCVDQEKTSGVFLTDAEYERMKNCDNCKHTYEACFDCPNGEKWQPTEAK